MAGGILPDAGDPTTTSTSPPPSSTMVGEMVVEAILLGPNGFREEDGDEKLPIAELRNVPAAQAPLPKYNPCVMVSDTALPSASTTEMCVVSAPSWRLSSLSEVSGVRGADAEPETATSVHGSIVAHIPVGAGL